MTNSLPIPAPTSSHSILHHAIVLFGMAVIVHVVHRHVQGHAGHARVPSHAHYAPQRGPE